MAVERQPPVVLALVLADAVHRAPATEKCYILGTYSRVATSEFPFKQESICAYVVLSDGHAETELRFRLVDVDESREPIFDIDATVSFPDPLAVVEIMFVETDVVFPEPGEYRLQLFGANNFLAERRLFVELEESPDSH